MFNFTIVVFDGTSPTFYTIVQINVLCHIHFLYSYRKCLLRNSSTQSSYHGRRQQKRIIRIMMGYKRNQSCRELFHKLGILSLPSQYIFYLLIFLNKNKNQFIVNSEVRNYTTRQHTNFHLPSISLTKCQKGIGYLGVKSV